MCELFGRSTEDIDNCYVDDIQFNHEQKHIYLTFQKETVNEETFYGIALSGEYFESVTLTSFDWTNSISLKESI